jgi:hypothetical protein
MDTEPTIDLIRTLDDEAIGPPIVDLTAAMEVGRRRLRRRRTGQAVVAVAAVTAAIVALPLSIQLVRGAADGPASPASTNSLVCSESLPPAPSPGDDVIGDAVDPTGHYQVGRTTGANGRPPQIVLWHDGNVQSATDATTDAGFGRVNSHGAAIGGSTSMTTSRSTGWFYADGKESRLAGPADFRAMGINNRNVIVGYENDANGLPSPIVWHTPTSQPKLLKLPDGWTGEADAVNDDGTIAGIGAPKGSDTSNGGRGIIWRPDGSYELMPDPAAFVPGVNVVRVVAIHGDIVDLYANSRAAMPYPPPYLRYNLATGAYSHLVPTGSMEVNGTNAAGWAVGWARIGGADAGVVRTPAFGIVTLPTMFKYAPREHPEPETISDDGRIIAGLDKDRSGTMRAVIWTCDPR